MDTGKKYLGLFLNLFIILVWIIVSVSLVATAFEKKEKTKIYQPNYEKTYQKENDYQSKEDQSDYNKDYRLAFDAAKEEDGGYRVTYVKVNSDADGQGLKVGDKIVSIGGFSLVGKTETEVNRLMTGKKNYLIDVVVIRNDGNKTYNKTTLAIYPDLEIE